MGRSLSKGPFVDEHLAKKLEALNAAGLESGLSNVATKTIQ